jgi:protein involved in polysaccharide export with SLBB domain/beta-lactamase regulating signal transducer with metallopeptidase domain
MSPLNVLWEAVPSASALFHHLWQSTLFVGACWFAARLLNHNRASVRYSVWLAASVKFLVPLSVLVGVGSYAGDFTNIRVVPDKWVAGSNVKTIEPYISQTASQRALPLSSRNNGSGLVQRILVGGWLAGVAGVAIWGFVRWRHLAARIGKAMLSSESKERDALRKVQSRYGWTKPVRLALSPSSIEPGVRGIVRPVLFLPAGITNQLTEEQLETVIAHELCHVRRRDNLTSALHMIVQTVFWFHPIVWWVGSRIVEERERSCDEHVLKMGSDPQVYASAILRVCEFYLATPLAIVSRVTGSNLKTRIEDIMTPRITLKMGSGRKLLLAFAAVVFVATPVLFGMATAPARMTQNSLPSLSVPGQTATIALRPIEPPAPPASIAQARPPAAVPVQTIPSPGVRATPLAVPPAVALPRADYQLHPGDELDIVVWKQPELTRRVVVRPDGKIGVPLVGDVPVEGLTPVAVQSAVQNELRRFIEEPHVTIIVATARKPQVTIQGAIAHPGAYSFEGRLTVLQLIAQAGGLSEFAKRDQISVFREEGGVVRRLLFDYGAFLAGANLDQNIVLKEDDIVIVP